MAKFRSQVTNGLSFCMQIICKIQKIPGTGYFGVASLFWFMFPCILMLFNHPDRHTNTYLHPLALWSKSRRWHTLEMHGFTECRSLLRHPLLTSLLRYFHALTSSQTQNIFIQVSWSFLAILKKRKKLINIWVGRTGKWHVIALPILTYLFRQIFPFYADLEHVPLQNSALMRIRQKRQEQRASSATMEASD